MKTSDLLVKSLEAEGVEYIFALPGEEVEDLLFSLQNSSIKLITCRHEQAAAFMADVWGRLTGKAGVCMATLGPGATNLITGLADAHMDKSPVVAITGQADTKRMHKESHQMIDVVNLFKPITKWNTAIYHGEIVPEAVRKAFKLAQEEKPGVTHIELSEDIAEHDIQGEPIKPHVLRRSSPDYKAIQNALELLKSAKKPIILAGNGAIRKLASKHLRMFVEHTNIPVVSTFMGKGALSDEDPRSLRSVGLQAKDFPIYAFQEADLILAIGFDIAELYPITLKLMNPNKDKKIIHIDFVEAEVYEYFHPEVEIISDISATLWQLNQHLEKERVHFDTDWYAPIRKAMEADLESYEASDEKPLSVPNVLHTLRKVMGKDDIVISDVGAHKTWISRNLPIYTPGTCIISNGFASMGIAVPGGIAAKLAFPEKNVIAISGDGGFLMNSQEIETAKRIGTGFTIIIVNDNNYGLITWKQTSHVNKSYGTELQNPDFVKYAESFGVKAHHPKNATELEACLKKVLPSNEINVVVVDVDPGENMKLTEKMKGDLGKTIEQYRT